MSNLGNKEIFSRNLQRYMDKEDVKTVDISRALNVAYSTVSDWVNGKSYPRIDKIEMLANYFGIEKSDLIENKIDLSKMSGLTIERNLINVPILGSVICRNQIMPEENFQGYFKLDPDICNPDFSLYAEDDSMIDANINEGDLVFFRKTSYVESGLIACVLLDDKVTIKKVIKANDTLILQPQNDAYIPIVIHDGDNSNIQILGEMIGLFSARNK